MPAIKWRQATRQNGEREPYGLVSECLRFRIGKFFLLGKIVYGLLDGTKLVDWYSSADDAKKKAQTLI
jgi:hypothetical protein